MNFLNVTVSGESQVHRLHQSNWYAVIAQHRHSERVRTSGMAALRQIQQSECWERACVDAKIKTTKIILKGILVFLQKFAPAKI